MEFSVNSPVLFVLSGIVVAVVVAQSIYFLLKAVRRANEIGIDSSKIKKVMVNAAIFTIAPAIAIVISVIALSKSLGIPLPWVRLSVVGSLSYETIAASNAMTSMGLSLGQAGSLNADQYVTILLVMTISIFVGIWMVPLVGKKVQGGLVKLENRDKKWADIFTSALFIGMISAFVGYVFGDVLMVFEGSFKGLIPVFVMLVSSVVMIISGLLLKKYKIAWISDYALPISLVVGMASAIPLTSWMG